MGKKDMFNKLKGTKLEDFDAISEVNKLQKIDLKVGSGKECTNDSMLKAHYTGALCSDGTIFESSHDTGKPLMFRLDQVIEGWRVGIPGMKEGGKRRLIIPSSIAYGEISPSNDIPANSDLVFDVEVVKVS